MSAYILCIRCREVVTVHDVKACDWECVKYLNLTDISTASWGKSGVQILTYNHVQKI